MNTDDLDKLYNEFKERDEYLRMKSERETMMMIQPGQLIAIGWELSNIEAMLNCAHKHRKENPMEWDVVISFLVEKREETQAEYEHVSALLKKISYSDE